MLLCFLATLSIALVSLLCAQRLKLDGRAETVIAATVIGNWLIVGPVYALGLTGTLTRDRLVAAAIALATVTATGACRGHGQLWAGTARTFIGILRMPFEAVQLTWRDRSPALIGVCFSFLVLLWTAFAVYLAPSWRHWDALWYHEPMTAFAIQNRGFTPMMDYGLTQKINGYPRLGEMTQLWFGLLGDRRIIELPNVLFGPALMCSAYKLSKRFSGSTSLAVGWAAALLSMPGCLHLLQTTLIDPHATAVVLASAHFTLRRPLAAKHAALVGLSLGLAVGVKVLTIVIVSALCAILAGRIFRTLGGRSRVLALVVSALPVLGMGSCTYVRNWIIFGNPVWPDLKVKVPALGIDWPGSVEWQPKDPNAYGSYLNMNLPLAELLEYFFAKPWSVQRWHYGQIVDYGAGIVWVLLPMGVLALLIALPCRILDQWRSQISSRARMASSDAALIALVLVVTLVTSPALWAPRYHIASVGLFMALVSWMCTRYRAQRFEGAAQLTVQMTAIMHLFWAQPREWVDLKTARALLSVPYPERELRPELGAPVTLQFGLVREREIGANDVVVGTDFPYPAIYWNNRYTNVVRYLENGPNFLQRAEKLGATWVCCGGGNCLAEARAAAAQWSEVGRVHPAENAIAFRKLKRSAASPPAPSTSQPAAAVPSAR